MAATATRKRPRPGCSLLLLACLAVLRGATATAEAATAPKTITPSPPAARSGNGSPFSGFHLGTSKAISEEEIEPEDDEIRKRGRRARWINVDESDPVVSVIRSLKDLFPSVRVRCEPTTTIKLRKRFYPLKTVLTLGADYNTQSMMWQFRSNWEDEIIGGRISVSGRQLSLTKSWPLPNIVKTEDVITRLKFKGTLDTRNWTAHARIGLRTERIEQLNVKEGFTLSKRLPLDGSEGHAKLEVVTRLSLPEPQIQFSTDGSNNRGDVLGMGDVHVQFDELNLLLEY